MAKTVRDPWHFPRGEFVDQVLKISELKGLVRRLAMFAPRRKGKTAFLLQDLAPALVRRGHLPIYASLWENPNAPHRPIIKALQQGVDVLGQDRRAWRRYLGTLQQVSLRLGAATATWQLGAPDPRSATPDDLSAVGDLFRAIVENAGELRVFFLLDEAQHLAVSETFGGLTAALRTALDTAEAQMPSQLFSLFTGSSRTNLTRLLSDPKAPFYQSVERIDLPDLDRDFTDFISAQLLEIGGVRVSPKACWEAFEQFDRSPYYMEAFVRALLLKRATDAKSAVRVVLESLGNDPQFLVRWQALRPLDRSVYLVICDGLAPYSREALERLAAETGRDIKTSSVQRPLQRLVKEGLISARGRGQYQNEDAELVAWLRFQTMPTTP